MGLIITRVRFDGVPPDEADVRRELEARLGSSYGFESLVRNGSEIAVSTMMDPVTEAYVLKILAEHGGTAVDFRTGQPRDRPLPAFVDRPWRSHPVWTRARIRILIFGGFIAAGIAGLVTSFFHRRR